MHERFMQFGFENLVFPLKFNEMRLDGHTKPPRLSEIRFDPDDGVYMSQYGCRWGIESRLTDSRII
jgi:hypothetical protein